MRRADSQARSSNLTPFVSSHVYDQDFTDDESSEDSSSESPGLSMNHRNVPPRPLSQPNDDHQLSGSLGRSEPTEHNQEYFKAYWENIHARRRADPHSLPLIPYTDELYGSMDSKNRYRAPLRKVRAYERSTPRRPLIDFIHNEWKNNVSSSGNSPRETDTPTLIQIISAPLFRRSILILFLFWFLIWGSWKYWVEPQSQERIELNNALQGKFNPGQNMYGTNARPEFRDMIHIRTINQKLIPQKGHKARLIVVGDVHGCVDELVALLTQVSYNAAHDHLVFTGDMVSKGPSSASVIKLAMSMKASCVRGNHEDRILLAYRDINSHSISLASLNRRKPRQEGLNSGGPTQLSSETTFLDAELFPHGNSLDRELARSFNQEQIDYMASCPVILRLGQVSGMGEVQVVHAGLVPGVKLERQDPVGVMNMRTIDLDTHVPSRGANGTPWNKLWAKYQTSLPKRDRSTVIYGHDSRRGLRLTKYTKGIDTGCVKGGKLTALVITGQDDAAGPKTFSVDCKDYRAPDVQREESLGSLGQS